MKLPLAVGTLVAIQILTTSFIDAFSGGNHRYVIDYLAEEVMAQQPGETQAFLLQPSILGNPNLPTLH